MLLSVILIPISESGAASVREFICFLAIMLCFGMAAEGCCFIVSWLFRCIARFIRKLLLVEEVLDHE